MKDLTKALNKISKNMDLVLGIDIGGQSTKLGVVDKEGRILSRAVITSSQQNLDSYVKDLTSAIKALREETSSEGNIIGIGVGAPNANYYKGTIEYAPNLSWAKDAQGNPTVVNIADRLQAECGLTVKITNDANAAAVGEMTYGVAKGLRDFIMITLGTGVGSGIVIDGKIVYGHDGFAGELGHVCVEPQGRACNCGLRGCLETYASAIGVKRTAVEMLQAEPMRDSLLRNVEIDKLSSKVIYEAALKGDELSKEIFLRTGRILGMAFAGFVKFSAPEAIVIFGGLAGSREFFHSEMENTMNDHLMSIWKNKVKILYSSLKDSDAAILGASALVWN